MRIVFSISTEEEKSIYISRRCVSSPSSFFFLLFIFTLDFIAVMYGQVKITFMSSLIALFAIRKQNPLLFLFFVWIN